MGHDGILEMGTQEKLALLLRGEQKFMLTRLCPVHSTHMNIRISKKKTEVSTLLFFKFAQISPGFIDTYKSSE